MTRIVGAVDKFGASVDWGSKTITNDVLCDDRHPICQSEKPQDLQDKQELHTVTLQRIVLFGSCEISELG